MRLYRNCAAEVNGKSRHFSIMGWTLHSIAVVPIFVNAGTALLPAIVAGAASVVALLFKPRELLSICRSRPAIPVGVVVVIGAICGALAWFGGDNPAAAKASTTVNLPRIDWAKKAKELILAERAASQPTVTGGLKPRWTYSTDGAMVLSSPRIAAGRVYCASALQNVDGKIYGTIFCLDEATGKPIWTADSADGKPFKGFFSSPALSEDGKNLVIGQGLHDDKDSDLLCLDAATGKLRWHVATPLHIESSPAIFGDMAVAGAGAIEDANRKPTGDIGFVLAVRISDGQVLWKYAVNDPESSPAISPQGIVYIGSGFNGQAVVALRSESDEELKKKCLPRLIWRVEAPYPVTGAVTLVDDMVVVGAGNSDYVFADPNPAGIVMALDAKTGQMRWKAQLEDAVLGKVAAFEGKLLCPVRNGEVLAMNAADGKVLWRQRVSGKAPILAGPAVPGRYVYAVSRDGYLAVLDLLDGKALEKHPLNDPSNPGEGRLSLSSPILADGCVFVGSETGGLRCFAGGKGGQ